MYFPNMYLPFNFHNDVFWWAELLNFYEVQFCQFFFFSLMAWHFDLFSEKSFPTSRVQRYSLIFSSGSLKVLGFAFRFMRNFKLIFVCGVRLWSKFSPLRDYSTIIYWKDFLLTIESPWYLSQNQLWGSFSNSISVPPIYLCVFMPIHRSLDYHSFI